MGNESFFIKVLPSGVRPTRIDGALHFTGRSAIRAEDFRKELINLPLKITPYKQRTEIEYLIVEDAVVVDSGEENSWLQEITLISCFSWYLESLHISFRLVELIHNYIVPVTVFHPAHGEFVPTSERGIGLTFTGLVKAREFIYGYEWGCFQFTPDKYTPLDPLMTSLLQSALMAKFKDYQHLYKDVHERNVMFEIRGHRERGFPMLLRDWHGRTLIANIGIRAIDVR